MVVHFQSGTFAGPSDLFRIKHAHWHPLHCTVDHTAKVHHGFLPAKHGSGGHSPQNAVTPTSVGLCQRVIVMADTAVNIQLHNVILLIWACRIRLIVVAKNEIATFNLHIDPFPVFDGLVKSCACLVHKILL